MSNNCLNNVCLIGKDISDSKSKLLQNYLYKKFQLPFVYSNEDLRNIDDLESFLEKCFCNKYIAANITYPYKQNVAAIISDFHESSCMFVDVASFVAEGSNLVIHKGENFYLYNLDGLGCVKFLLSEGISLSHKNVAILGTGVTAKSIAYAFSQNECAGITFVSRTDKSAQFAASMLSDYCNTKGCAYKDARDTIANADIIIDATTVYDHCEYDYLFSDLRETAQSKADSYETTLRNADSSETAIREAGSSETALRKNQIVMDVKYKGENSICKQAKLCGVRTYDGLGMLVAQAVLTILKICEACKIDCNNSLSFDTIFNAGYQYLKNLKETNCDI